MADLVIYQGEEFKAAVHGKIKENDIFFRQYEDATRMLNDIVSGRDKKRDCDKQNEIMFLSQEYSNNIIAFCGNRGGR